MTVQFDRRLLMQLSMAALPAVASLSAGPANARAGQAAGSGPEHDFDFFLGSWNVRHRRLKQRLVGNNDWEEFDGSTRCLSILGGMANLNDSISYRGGRESRGMGLRAWDAASGTWADWYLSGASPSQIGPPGVGRFENGVGTFLHDEEFEGRPVKVRGIFTSISPSLMQWEQAFSPDDGQSWETNWVMRYTRTG